MKAPRRASRPTGAPPNNILAPYPRHPRPPFSSPRSLLTRPRYYRLYERRSSAGGTFIFITRTREDTTERNVGSRAAEVEITTAGGSKKQKEEGKGEKERETSDWRCYAAHTARSRMIQPIFRLLSSRNVKPSQPTSSRAEKLRGSPRRRHLLPLSLSFGLLQYLRP